MPGHIFNLICSGCSAEHRVQTGETIGGRWLEQKVCPRCQTIVSCWPQEPGAEFERCPECKGVLEPWAGKVWFEPKPDAVMAGDEEENVEGPCPKCGTKISLDDQGNADGSISIILWD